MYSRQKLVFVLSGTFTLTKQQLVRNIKEKGYLVDDVIRPHKKNCYILCVGREPKLSKKQDARLLNVPIVKESFLDELLASDGKLPDITKHLVKDKLRQRTRNSLARRPRSVTPYISRVRRPDLQDIMEDDTPRRVIALEGDIGVGKSTLCNKFKAQFPQTVAIYREQTNELFLRLFYSNPSKYGFAFQWGMLKSRLYQLKLAQHDVKHGRKPPKSFFFWDRSMIGDYIFALWNHLLGSISRQEMEVYESEFGGSVKELAAVPFLTDIHLFVLLNDEPARCKWRVEQSRKNPSEQGIPLSYYEGIDDIHFYLFVFKLMVDRIRPAIVINWGQYHDAEKTMRLIRSVLDGSRKPPAVSFLERNNNNSNNDPISEFLTTASNYNALNDENSEVLIYHDENDILNFYSILKNRKETDDETNPMAQQYPKKVYVPVDVLRISEREKGVVENDYGILFFTNEFKRVVCWHLAHFQNICFYHSKEQFN